MALKVECPTCEGEMTWSARRCLHCGALSPRVQGNRRSILILATTVVLVAFLLYYFLRELGPAFLEYLQE